MVAYDQLTARDIARLVSDGSVTAVEFARQALTRAKTVGKELNAFITICEDKALAQAEAVDASVKAGESVGPMAGVPIAVKDNISYRDYPTTCGSRMLENYVPVCDATVITRLTEAGAVLIGKTNMDEFAMGSSSETSHFGPVKNPHDPTLTPGGSSGGSAAAVAARIVPVALGSDTGGSVRQPAAFCDIYGLKPTYGAVSRYGLVAYSSSEDQIGPLARDLTDLALIQKVIAGHDDKDATSVEFDHPDYPELIRSDRKFTIGVPQEYFAEGLDAEVRSVVDEAYVYLKQERHTFVPVSLPLTDKAVAAHYIIAPSEASANLARYDGMRYGLKGEGTSYADVVAAARTEGFGPEVKRRIMLGTYALSAGYYDEYYLHATRVRRLIQEEFARVFQQVDLLIAPVSPTPAFELGEKIDDPLEMYLSDVYTVPANLAGLPGISVPFGHVVDGRAVGVQFLAPPFRELSLFQIAHDLMEKRR